MFNTGTGWLGLVAPTAPLHWPRKKRNLLNTPSEPFQSLLPVGDSCCLALPSKLGALHGYSGHEETPCLQHWGRKGNKIWPPLAREEH